MGAATRGRAARQRFARRDSKTRPTFEVSPPLSRAIVLPLEGKGDRSAVDEVTCGPAPLRGASIAYCLLPIAFFFIPMNEKSAASFRTYRTP